MFEDPPTWTLPIANLTGWFDWDALGAIGTVGALWYAVVQGFRSARFDRLRAAGVLTKLLELVGPIAEFTAYDEDRNIDVGLSQRLVADGMIKRALTALPSISLEAIPDPTVTSYVETLMLVLPRLEESLSGLVAELFPPPYDDNAAYVAEAYDYFWLLREVYQRNSWSARRTLWKRFWRKPA